MNGNRSKRERGQAMAEYAVLFPAAVAILIVAGGIGFVNRMMYTEIITAFVQTGIEEQCEPVDEGPTVAEMNGHLIEACGAVYNEAADVTTITYCVTNGNDPSISHWVMGVDRSFYNAIISVSEQYEWTDDDPSTHVAGIKFDTGYESSGGGNDKDNKGRGNASLPSALDMTAMKRLDLGGMSANDPLNEDLSDYDATARDVIILVSGEWDADGGTVSIKAGTETYYSTITLPTIVTEDESCN